MHFTQNGNTLYAIALDWPSPGLVLNSIGSTVGKVEKVELLSVNGPQPLTFVQDEKAAVSVAIPAEPVGEHAFAFKITGLIID